MISQSINWLPAREKRNMKTKIAPLTRTTSAMRKRQKLSTMIKIRATIWYLYGQNSRQNTLILINILLYSARRYYHFLIFISLMTTGAMRALILYHTDRLTVEYCRHDLSLWRNKIQSEKSRYKFILYSYHKILSSFDSYQPTILECHNEAAHRQMMAIITPKGWAFSSWMKALATISSWHIIPGIFHSSAIAWLSGR